MRRVRELAAGKWTGVLVACGVDKAILDKRHHPCPFCGGKDRFRFVDKIGDGFWMCNQCGSGDGFDFLEQYLGSTMADVKDRVAGITSSVASDPPPRQDKDKREAIVDVLNTPEVDNPREQLGRYLSTRGIDMSVIGKPNLLMVKGLSYYRPEGSMSLYAMLAKVENKKGELVSAHRTYFGVPEGEPKRKMMSPYGTINGAAIRLYPARDTLIISEGIETALAARQLMLGAGRDIPCWAAISAHGMECVALPDSIKKVYVFGDTDNSFTGQAASYSLAQTLVREKREVVVKLPPDGDWNDFLLKQNSE